MADEAPLVPGYDTAAARAAGVSDKSIADFLASKVPDYDLTAARKAGVRDSAIVDFLAPPQRSEPVAQPSRVAAREDAPPEPVSGMALGMAKGAGQTVLGKLPELETGVGAMMKSAGQAEAVESRRDVGLMQRLDQGEDFGALMKAAPNDLARLALAQYRRSTPEQKTAMRQEAINTLAAPPNALERGGANALAAGQQGAEDAKKLIPLTPEEEGRPSVVVAKTAASLLTFLAAAGPAGVPGMVAYGGVESYGKTYEEAKKAGATDEDATVAAAISGVVQGGLNAVPAHKALQVADQIPKMFKGEFIKTLTEMAKSGGTLLGFTQVSQLADNYIAKETFDPTRKPTEGLGQNLGATFTVGALLPAVPAAARSALRLRAKTPEEVAKPVLDATNTDDAIAAAQRAVAEGTPVDIGEIKQNAEYGTTGEQDQAKLLQLFSGMNRGEVIQAEDGAYHYRRGEGETEETHPLKVWNPDAAPVEGAEPTISPQLAAAQRDAYEKMGIRVVYFEGDRAIPFDGAVDPKNPDTIFLSNDPSRNVAQVGAHEIGHTLENTTLPDGTNLGDIFHGLIEKNLTGEGWRRANELFGSTAPDRASFPNTPEGQAAHGDAIVRHLVTEIGAETMAELPKFQTFMPKVIDEVQSRYGVDAAKGVLLKLLDGIRSAMNRLREFYFRPEDHAEYGQPQVEAQKWLTNLAAIEDVGAKMYAVRFGEQGERETALLAGMRDKAQRERFLANFDRPASEVPPPTAPEGFAAPVRTEEPAKAAIPPETPAAPEDPRPPGPMSDPAAYAEAASRAVVLRRWLGEIDAERRSTAPASPQAALLKQTEAAILAKVAGVEARLTQAQTARLAEVRAQIDALHNPTEPSADMVKVRQALEAEQQRMADAASIGSPATPIRSETVGNDRKPVSDLSDRERIRAVMPESTTKSDAPPAAETGPVAERPQPAPAAPPRAAPAPIAEPPLSAFATKVKAERERLWAEEMPGYKREGGTTRQGLASASAGNERMVTEAARDKVMREEIGEDTVMDAIERGLTDDQIFAIARFYRPEEGKTPQEAFRDAVDRYAALEHEQALREEAAGLFDPDYDALKVDNPDLAGMERAYRLMEEANARERAASEAPFESGEADGDRRADSPEVPERSGGEEAGGQSGGRGAVPGEAGVDEPKFSPRVRTPEQIEADKAFATDKTVMEKIRGKMENLPENAVIQTLDRFYGVKNDDPLGYMGLRLSNNAAGATEAFMTAATLRFDGRTYNWKERTGGVEALVKGLGVEAMDFAKWIAGHRAEILKGEGRENLLNDTQIRGLKSLNQGTLSEPYTLASGKTTMSREAAYLDALKKYHDLNRNVMDLAVEGGLITRKVADDLLKNPFYIPFYRVDPREGEQFVAPNSSSASVKQTAFKKLKGGTEQLNDLWENATSNWAHLIEAALKNKNTIPVLKTAVQQGAATKLTAQEALHLSDKQQKATTVWVMENGEKQFYRIEDKGLFAAVSVLEPVINVPVISPLARGAKTLLQTGVTMNPAFAIRNVTRDTQQVLATTPISWNVANNLYTGFKENNAARAIENLGRALAGKELKDAGMSDTALSALASGALMRFGDVADAGVRQTKIKVGNRLETPEAFDAFWEGLKRAGGAYRKTMAQSEDVSRIALFKQLKDQGLPTDFAAFSAKDIADFSLTGAAQLVRTLNSMSAFTNARMQGLYKVARSAADADKSVPVAVGARVGLGIMKRAATVVLAGALVDLGLDALYANDEDWKKRDEFDKNSNYWFKIGKTEFRIPKGFEVGAVSRLGAIFAESFYDKEMTAGRALTNAYSILANNLNLNPTPTILKPALDIYGNSNAASGNPIVPRGLERLQAEQRYTINNTMQARGISTAMNEAMRAAGMKTDGLSPIQVDYLARAYGGWLVSTSMQMGDTVARSFTSEPARPAEDRLAYYTGGMVSSEPRSASRYVNMLYEQGDAIEKAYATYRDMLTQGHAAEAQKFFADNKDELLKHGLVSGVMRLEGNINKQIRMITNNPDPRVTPEQKHLQIMQLQAVKNRAAQQAMGAPPDAPRSAAASPRADSDIQHDALYSMTGGLLGTAPEQPTKMVNIPREARYPDAEDLGRARLFDQAYGDRNARFFETGDAELRQIATKLAPLVVNDSRYDEVPWKKVDAKTADMLYTASIAANRSAIASLGFDPRKMVLSPPSEHGLTAAGTFEAKHDAMWVDQSFPSAMVHESFHRGLEQMRKNGVLAKDAGTATPEKPYVSKREEENMVRALMIKNFGMVEKGSGDLGDEQVEEAARSMDTKRSPVFGANFNAKLAAVESLAAREIARLSPRGPR